ncbi:MAG: SIR2 family NAD-dependent protein deacylase [Candidatus Polarisedimenticolia bacterium]
MKGISARLGDLLESDGRVAVLTGAGISAESGIATFRDPDGLWENERIEDVATPEAFRRDPARVWRWYDARRRQIAAALPNAGHRALADYESRHPGFTLVTQNVDGLHRAAGSRNLVTLHGEIFRVRCVREGTVREDRRASLPEIPPRCGCGALLRPDVVWFGEALPEDAMAAAVEAAGRAALFLVIGTSALVYPAASLPEIARRHGAYLVEINVEPTPLSLLAHETIQGKAAEVLPAILGGPGPGGAA